MHQDTNHHPRLDFLLLGAPGSGKGTQAALLVKEFGLPHIATGDLFRENLKNQTELGKLAKSYMDRGQLVPDEVTANMMQERLSRADVDKGFILDGFPRTVPQAEALTAMLARMRRRVLGVLYIKVSDAEIVNRLSGRLICHGCQAPFHPRFKPPQAAGVCDKCGGQLYQRDDDKPATVTARLTVFHQQTAPLIDYYGKSGLVHEINGETSVPEVSRQTLAAVLKLAETMC
jgi:adenylate kinase